MEGLLWKWGSISLNVVMAAVVDGTVTREELQKALERLQERHALLKVRIELDAGNRPWFTSDDVPEIEIRHCSDAAPGDWLKMAHEELTVSHNWKQGPLVRLVLLTGTETTELVVNCHHCIADGLSVAYFIRDLLDSLDDSPARFPQVSTPPLLEDSLPQKIILNPAVCAAVAIANFFFGRSKLRAPLNDLGKDPCAIVSWQLNHTQTDGFVRRCRREGVSVHSALTTAFQEAQYQVQGEKKHFSVIYTPASIRNRLTRQVGKAFGLYFSEVYIRQKYLPERGFWQMARVFHGQIQKATTDQKLLAVNKLIEKVTPSLLVMLMIKQVKNPKIRFGYMVSNLGRLDFGAEPGHHRVKAVYGPIVYVNCAEKAVGVATVAGRMYFTLTWLTSILDPDIVEKIKKRTVRILLQATACADGE